ncbi:hypothetical protein M440DRAFT_1274807 [Trichoderma longibrachiatum ATCC 18648]|uniref:Uncharacterized protein n=1 Tax=Trichoderma longibrachiatum ATCC 18648 TaxID=983965 RepID=A0A2T4C1Q6_TRILO|nr:hypothetical protein M440DRAFT_1274807 [Trichoderma longibrachiatum ATCC 18648]
MYFDTLPPRLVRPSTDSFSYTRTRTHQHRELQEKTHRRTSTSTLAVTLWAWCPERPSSKPLGPGSLPRTRLANQAQYPFVPANQHGLQYSLTACVPYARASHDLFRGRVWCRHCAAGQRPVQVRVRVSVRL